MTFDFDMMRQIIYKAPVSSPKIRQLRLHLFDLYRYSEDYDKLYQMMHELKKVSN